MKANLFPLVLLALLLALAALPAAAQERPNIVFMMTDNLGWGEIGVYGGGILRGAETPRLDQLAAEGMRLLNFNVEPQCTPSRSALMTGRHPIRSGTTKVVWGSMPPVLERVLQFQQSLAEEPPIRLGTPDPYVPPSSANVMPK